MIRSFYAKKIDYPMDYNKNHGHAEIHHNARDMRYASCW
jgi:hypothetical protein